MSPEQSGDSKSSVNRAERFVSHALVEVRKFKQLPFFVDSAVLLDISVGGFKIEFTGDRVAKPGEKFWLSIPLSPLGIFAPTRISCKGECRWFDAKRFRVGGTFSNLSEGDRMVIQRIVENLQERGLSTDGRSSSSGGDGQ